MDIQHVIIHEVLRQKAGTDKKLPIYSEAESELNRDTKLFLRDKLINSIGSSNAHEILFDDNFTSPVPEILKKLLAEDYDNQTFIKSSEKLADHLNNIQSAINSAGFILIFYGFNIGKKVIGISKLEKVEGAQLKQSQRGGKSTFEITNLKNLILSKNTKLFKIAVYEKETDGSYFGNICDNQLSVKGEVANFFLRTFLGCKLKADYAIETKNFYNYSIDFIKNIDDPLIQNQYKLSLQTYVLNNQNVIEPRRFASTYLQINHRHDYEIHLVEKDVPLTIIKDRRYIENNIKKYLYKFENGIQIIGTKDDFEEQVKLESLENGNTRATVESRLENI